MKFTVRPLTPDLWPQIQDLFGRVGACSGCWCMYWRIGGTYTQKPRGVMTALLGAAIEHARRMKVLAVVFPAAHRPLMRLELAKKKVA